MVKYFQIGIKNFSLLQHKNIQIKDFEFAIFDGRWKPGDIAFGSNALENMKVLHFSESRQQNSML